MYKIDKGGKGGRGGGSKYSSIGSYLKLQYESLKGMADADVRSSDIPHLEWSDSPFKRFYLERI